MLMHDARRTTHDDGQKRMAIGHLSLLRWPKKALVVTGLGGQDIDLGGRLT